MDGFGQSKLQAAGLPPATPSRVVPTTGVHNFRDYGGYRVSGGGRLAWRRLYRAGQDRDATARDIEIVGELGLSAIVDLRGKSEREKSPSTYLTHMAIPIICANGETSQAPHEVAATSLDAESARRDMIGRYEKLPFARRLGNVYRRYFELLADIRGPTLVYCAAGKDRTGLLVALLHHAVGVHHDDIFEDYLFTNTAGDTEARIAALRNDLEWHFGSGLSDEAVHVVASVEPLFLQTAFDSIIARHGSIDAYLAEVLGVSASVKEALVERLVIHDETEPTGKPGQKSR
jgi:protein-tyrosine phosphatase